MHIRPRFSDPVIVFVSVALAVFSVPRFADASWPLFGRPVCTAAQGQMHGTVAADGTGGAIVVWQDLRFPSVNIFAQHVLASGELDAAWPLNGSALLNDAPAMAGAAGGQSSPVVIADGTGGAIVAWSDNRSAVTATDIFAQHILASGVVDPTWPANGVPLCVIEGLQHFQTIASDDAGGAIVTWVDGRNSEVDAHVFAQRVLASGIVDPGWPVNGMEVCATSGPQGFPVITEDETGGAIIAWHDGRDALTSGADVYVQHVLSSGIVDPAWPSNGRGACTAVGDQSRPTIVPDAAQGAIVAWTDSRVFATGHIFAQHVLASGAVDPAWPANGRGISNAAVLETVARAVPDGAGGAIVTWQGLTTHSNIYVQHVMAAGVVDPAWPAAGKALSNSNRRQNDPEIAGDGAGGAVVAWEDSSDVVAQHVLASGTLDSTYPETGRAVCNLPSKQGEVALVATGAGGAIVVWTDGRNLVDADIYALQVLEAGTATGIRTPIASSVRVDALPNPFSGSTRIAFTAPGGGSVDVQIFDVRGRVVRRLSGAPAGGGYEALWDGRTSGGEPAPSGVYFCRVSTPAGRAVQRLVLLR